MRRSRKRKNKEDILTYPLSLRQVQKLWPKISSNYEMLDEICGGWGIGKTELAQLQKLAQQNPNQQVKKGELVHLLNGWVEDDSYEDYEYEDYEYEDEDEGYSYEDDYEYEELADNNSSEVTKEEPTSSNQKEEGEIREKDTDEANEASENPSDEADTHGGDGNSGECDHEAQTTQENRQPPSQSDQQSQEGANKGNSGTPPRKTEGDKVEPADGSETGNTSEGQGPSSSSNTDLQSSSSPSLSKGEDSMPWESDGTEEKNCTPSPLDSPLQDEEESSQSVSGKGEDSLDEGQDWLDETSQSNLPLEQNAEEQQPQKKMKKFSEAEKGQVSASPRTSDGGITAQLRSAGISPKILVLLRQKLGKLIGGEGVNSPRYDKKKFVKRLLSSQNPSPARKVEEGRPVILLMADVSGSCSSFSDHSLVVIKAASKLGVAGADVIVLTHSNGWVHEVEINSKEMKVSNHFSYGETIEQNSWYQKLVKQYNIKVVIALGDWDALDQYLILHDCPTVEKFIWLDNAFCSSRGTVKDYTPSAFENIQKLGFPIKKGKLTYKNGCKDAISFVKAI